MSKTARSGFWILCWYDLFIYVLFIGIGFENNIGDFNIVILWVRRPPKVIPTDFRLASSIINAQKHIEQMVEPA